MNTILITVLSFFVVFTFFLISKIQTDRKNFKTKIKVLEDIIIQISMENKVQNNQLQLSDELKSKLKTINELLSRDIYEMNFNLVEELYKRK